MVGEIEAEKARSLVDVMALHQQTFSLVDDVVMDISDGCATCGFANYVTKVAW